MNSVNGGEVQHGWPRRDFPLLPRLLRRAWHFERLPRAALERAGLPPDTTAGELDSSVWDRVERNAWLAAIANYLANKATNSLYHERDSELANQPLIDFPVPSEATIESLALSRRTRHALERGGYGPDLGWLLGLSAADVLGLRGMGVKGLLELACSVEGEVTISESLGGVDTDELLTTPPNQEKIPAVETGSVLSRIESLAFKLESRFPLAEISTADPRFSHLRLMGSTLLESILRLIKSLPPSSNARSMAVASGAERTLRELERLLLSASEMPLDRCLMHLLGLVTPTRHLAALAARLGWDGRGGATLEAAGQQSGVSRERIRQIERRVEYALGPVSYVPMLDRAISVLQEAAAKHESDAGVVLQQEGITTEHFLPAGVVAAARVFEKNVSFEVGTSGRSVHPIGVNLGLFGVALRSLADVNHVASVFELQERLDPLLGQGASLATIRRWLNESRRAVWLDDVREWFWVPQGGGRDRYVNITRKVLAVTPRVGIDTLRDAIVRVERWRGRSANIPRRVLAGLCGAAGLCVEGEQIWSNTPIPLSVLGDVDRTLHSVFLESGPLLRMDTLRDKCLEAGVNRNSFFVHLSYSPIIERAAKGVYALRGARFDPVAAAVLAGRRRNRKPALKDSGWTRDRALWLGYTVNRNIVDTGVVYVPAGIRKVVGSRKMELYATDGALLGTLAISEAGQAWGLSPFFRRRGVEEGDTVIVTLDTGLDCAVVQHGSSELVSIYSDGEGWGPLKVLDDATRPEDLD